MSPTARLRGALAALAALHLASLLAGALTPYDPAEQNRSHPFAPPSRVRFTEAGRFVRPFVYETVEAASAPGTYVEDTSRRYPLRLLVAGAPYRLAGLVPARTRLFGVDEPARVFLLGTDGLGRDQFSRFLHGAQVSLLAGLLATALSLGTGFVLGALAGFYGRAVDAAVMRTAELFLALPWLYLLLAVRALLPLHVTPGQTFVLLVAVIGLVDWARPARLVRGVVLSARERDFVLAARAFGAGDAYLLRRHVAPQAAALLLTQAALLAPQYVLAEVTLSFLGLGISEPVPSWGNMLAALQQYHVLTSYWWMWIPGVALVPVFLAYQRIADALQERAARPGVSA
ncbi:MAG: ABC transporter permease [Vicinamibacteria bacterium]